MIDPRIVTEMKMEASKTPNTIDSMLKGLKTGIAPLNLRRDIEVDGETFTVLLSHDQMPQGKWAVHLSLSGKNVNNKVINDFKIAFFGEEAKTRSIPSFLDLLKYIGSLNEVFIIPGVLGENVTHLFQIVK